MDKITIKNISTATVVVSVPDLKIRRELIPGRSFNVSREDYEEMTFDPGFNGLINDHYLSVIGLDEETFVEDNTPVYDFSAIANMLDKLDVTAFAKFIPTAAQAERDTVVKFAVEKGITHPAFVKLIKQYCDVDVIAAINRKHQVEE